MGQLHFSRLAHILMRRDTGFLKATGHQKLLLGALLLSPLHTLPPALSEQFLQQTGSVRRTVDSSITSNKLDV